MWNRYNRLSVLLGVVAGMLATDVLAQAVPATIEWVLGPTRPIPTVGGGALALLGLMFLLVGLREMWRRRSTISGFLLLPVLAGALLTFQFSTHLIDGARAVAANILLDTSPTTLDAGANVVENIQHVPVNITALNDGACVIDQTQASDPVCMVGSTLGVGETCSVFVNCPPSGGMSPGSTDVVSAQGIDSTGMLDFRCLEWDGDSCIRPQSRVPAATCASYEDVDVWHDMTYYNSPEERICPSFCTAVTDSGTVVECVSAGVQASTTTNGNVSTGYSASQTGCVSTTDTRWRIDYAGQDGGLNIRHSTYGSTTPRLRIKCDWNGP